MPIFTWSDLSESYVRAVTLIDWVHTLDWLEDPQPDDDVGDGLTYQELRDDAVWARIWVHTLACTFAHVTGRRPVDILAELRTTCYPGGWDDRRSGDPLDL